MRIFKLASLMVLFGAAFACAAQENYRLEVIPLFRPSEFGRLLHKAVVFDGSFYYLDSKYNLVSFSSGAGAEIIALPTTGRARKIIGASSGTILYQEFDTLYSFSGKGSAVVSSSVAIGEKYEYDINLGVVDSRDGKILFREKQKGFYSIARLPAIDARGQVFMLVRENLSDSFGSLVRISGKSVEIIARGIRSFALAGDLLLCSTVRSTGQPTMSEEEYGLVLINDRGIVVADLQRSGEDRGVFIYLDDVFASADGRLYGYGSGSMEVTGGREAIAGFFELAIGKE
ncbi:MAG TPA: hypothetical protein PKW82_00120 [Spirochaetales bacterium]|nr:hypothetical protein [Spirochaetales bacterium]